MAHMFNAIYAVPLLFQYDVVPPENASVSSLGKKTMQEEPIKKKSSRAVRISPWALARLNAEEASRAAAEARKRSKILQPVVRREAPSALEKQGSKSKRTVSMDPLTDIPSRSFDQGLVGIQQDARSAFQTSRAMSNLTGPMGSSSPESSLDSPDIRPFHKSVPPVPVAANRGIPFSLPRNSASDGYDASGGEDSDRVPSRFPDRLMNRSSRLFSLVQDERVMRLKGSTSSIQIASRKL